jgi:hypothetical protein
MCRIGEMHSWEFELSLYIVDTLIFWFTFLCFYVHDFSLALLVQEELEISKKTKSKH